MTATSGMTVLAAVVALVLVGRVLLTVVARRMPLYWFERWALSYLMGTAVLSAIWIASSLLNDLTRPVWALSAVCAGAAIVAYHRGFRLRWFEQETTPEHEAGREGQGWPERLLGGLLILEFLVLVAASLRTSLGFDGLFNFEMKARLMFEHTAGRLPLAYLSDASRAWSHPQYPLMVPFAELWVYTWLGRVDHTAVKILFPLFYFSLVAIMCGFVRRMAGMRVALAVGVATGLMPPFTVLPGAASGYADVPLAAAIAGAVSFTAFTLRTGNPEAVTLAGVLLAIATWTKSEGALLAGCVGIAGAGLLHLRGSASIPFRRSSALIWIPAAAATPWIVVQARYGIPASDFLSVSVANVAANFNRLPAIGDLVVRELLRPGHWGLVWPAWGIAIVLAIRYRRMTDWFLIATVGIPLGLYVLPFMLSSWPDPTEHVRSALPRLLVPLAPVALAFTVVTLWNEWRVIRS